MTRYITYHYLRPGRGETTFEERLVLDHSDVKVTLLDSYDGPLVRADEATILAPGAPIVWFVFPGTWYDVGRFHLADGTFTGWYTNLCTPVEIRGADWYCTDLFLDLWHPADGSRARWLDEDEFRAAVEGGVVSTDLARRGAAERAALDEQVALNRWPPSIAQEIDLLRARTLAATE